MKEPVQSWEVEIRINGESVLTIGGLAAAHVAGIENIDEYADIVRQAAGHLESFVGHAGHNLELQSDDLPF
jgi:hypothetical protein